MRTLKLGSRGEDVRSLQYDLGIKVDGSFGPATQTAVKVKQRQLGFVGKEVDGSVGPATQKRWGLSDFRIDVFPKSQVWFAGTPYGAAVKPLKTLATWAKEENAALVYNLAWYNMSEKDKYGRTHDEYGVIKGRTLTYLRGKGYDIGYGGPADRLIINADNICSGVKVGIKDGKIQSGLTKTKTTINANGLLRDGSYFHAQSVLDSTEQALVQYINSNYDVSILFIQDGGGSNGKYDADRKVLLAGRMEGVNGRAVASVVCIGTSVTKPQQPKICPACGQVIK